jgi:hypothetical protein
MDSIVFPQNPASILGLPAGLSILAFWQLKVYTRLPPSELFEHIFPLASSQRLGTALLWVLKSLNPFFGSWVRRWCGGCYRPAQKNHEVMTRTLKLRSATLIQLHWQPKKPVNKARNYNLSCRARISNCKAARVSKKELGAARTETDNANIRVRAFQRQWANIN